ncbi:MAG: phosphatidylglycerophosphatase A, partial [Bacteroidota bacterium]|nr:phosphatidylglycerophosphatase A [Candidatus Kapabacteria bacterium]MDW8220963.1 phosphatidylglycerophosphatase A [Bacteroidota bacterium]
MLVEQRKNLPLHHRVAMMTASLGGVGCVPKIPGTVGSLVTLGAMWGSRDVRIGHMLVWSVGALVFSILAWWSVAIAERYWGNDSQRIVIDECIGMVMVILMLEVCDKTMLLRWEYTALLGFSIFRVFDILKPFPLSWLNAQQGAFFVLADDILAGIMAVSITEGIWLIWQ